MPATRAQINQRLLLVLVVLIGGGAYLIGIPTSWIIVVCGITAAVGLRIIRGS
jgi:hypothetical protein